MTAKFDAHNDLVSINVSKNFTTSKQPFLGFKRVTVYRVEISTRPIDRAFEIVYI